ncbi:MAG: sigma-70 family RNA polymerase sigma factor [Myxococcales bacterium]|nr:sigma-70 family RNA polymerase sigma factor [Myxococcales bacterium]
MAESSASMLDAARPSNGDTDLTGTAGSMADGIDIEAMYRDYGDLVYGRCRTLLGNEADAQEVAQDVFIRLMRYASGFRGDARPSTYLFKITTTTCLNRIRSRKRRREDMVEELPPTAANDTLLDDLELRQLLDVLLRDCDERTQSCVVYHYVDGMTHNEVGAVLGITGAAVRKRIAKFRDRVRADPPDWMEDR